VKPPPIARNSYRPGDLVTAADTTAEHAQACADLIARNGGANNAGPFTTWAFRAEGAPVKSSLVFPGGLGGANWGGVAWDPNSRYAFVVSQDDGAFGWMEKTPVGSAVPYDRTTLDAGGPGRGNFEVRMGGIAWPCQKPPWGRLTAVNTATGDFAWQIPLGVTEGLPEAKQNTGRPALAGAIVTAGGVLFVGSTDDNRFRAIEARTGKQLWVTKFDRRANANPITYEGRDGKQYVAIVATDVLMAFKLP
jgi:quinoprotein glucose dehydrogenase